MGCVITYACFELRIDWTQKRILYAKRNPGHYFTTRRPILVAGVFFAVVSGAIFPGSSLMLTELMKTLGLLANQPEEVCPRSLGMPMATKSFFARHTGVACAHIHAIVYL